MKRTLSWLTLLMTAFVASTLQADILKTGRSSLESSYQGADVEFLPVEEAYQLYPHRDGDQLRLDWIIAPGYYLYKDRFDASLEQGAGDGKSLPLVFDSGIVRYDDYYEKEVEVFYETTTQQASLPEGTDSPYLKVISQGCADAGLCYPPRTLYVALNGEGTLDVLPSLPQSQDSSTPSADSATSSLLLILLFAVAGGLILNLMPCVFPVLSIKVLSLSQSHLSSHGRHIHGLVYSAGVIVTFLAVALLLILLRSGGEALGWGFQLQSPEFISLLAALFFMMGLSFSGYFEAGTRLMNLGQSASAGHGLQHSFLTGVLATVVASPCSAPFMGTALGFALTQSTPIALLVFVALGFGMALPFLVLTWSPTLLDKMPRPGPWMETLKTFLAFPLYLTAVWLLWILGNQAGADVVAMVLCGMVLATMAIWMSRHRSWLARAGTIGLIAAALALPGRELATRHEKPLWEAYTPQRLEQLLATNEAVFINLTADWCITCLTNEKIALSSERVKVAMREQNITYLKGDWTNYNEDITALLNANGRSGVPLYLFYPAGQRKPIVLPQILTPTTVTEAFLYK